MRSWGGIYPGKLTESNDRIITFCSISQKQGVSNLQDERLDPESWGSALLDKQIQKNSSDFAQK